MTTAANEIRCGSISDLWEKIEQLTHERDASRAQVDDLRERLARAEALVERYEQLVGPNELLAIRRIHVAKSCEEAASFVVGVVQDEASVGNDSVEVNAADWEHLPTAIASQKFGAWIARLTAVYKVEVLR